VPDKEIIMRTIQTIAYVLISALAGASQAAPPTKPDQVQLQPVYRAGRVTRQRMVTKTVGSIKLFDPLPEQKFSQVFEQDVTMKCRKVNADKSAIVDMTMDRIAMKMTIGGLNMEFDSSAPAPPSDERHDRRLVGRIFSAMVGSTFTLTMGPDGEPVKIEGVKEMMKKMADGLGEEKMPAAIRKMFDQLGNLFGDDGMMQEMQSCTRMIPKDGPKRVGDKWEEKWDMKVPVFNGKIEGQGQYELLGIEEFRGRRCAKISVKETFSMAAAPAAENASNAGTATSAPAKGIFERLRFDLKASGGEGTAYWDYENGDLVQLRQTQRMTIEISLAPDANAEETDMKAGLPSMVQKLNTSESVDLLDDAEAAPTPHADRAGAAK
jgi:hypothetical protein